MNFFYDFYFYFVNCQTSLTSQFIYNQCNENKYTSKQSYTKKKHLVNNTQNSNNFSKLTSNLLRIFFSKSSNMDWSSHTFYNYHQKHNKNITTSITILKYMLHNFHLQFYPHQKTKKRIVSKPKRLKYYFNRSKAQTNQQYLDTNIFYQQHSSRNQEDRKSAPVERVTPIKVIKKNLAQPKFLEESQPKIYFRNAIMFNNDTNNRNDYIFPRSNTSYSARKPHQIKDSNKFLGISMTNMTPKHQQHIHQILSHNNTVNYTKRKQNLSAHDSYKEINPFTKQQYLYLSNKKSKPAPNNNTSTKNQQFMKITKFTNKKTTMSSNRTTLIQQTPKKRPQTYQTMRRTMLKKSSEKKEVVSKKNLRDYLLENKQDVTPWNMDFLEEFKTEQDQLL